jgi:hypothetical protein
VDAKLLGDYLHDRKFRRQFMLWLNALWAEKDNRIEMLLR